MWEINWDILGYLDLNGVCTAKIIVLTYVGRVIESLTKKNQSFQRFKNFRRFWVFVLNRKANL